MPHLIFSTRFPEHGQTAEIVFFGACEPHVLQALQAATLSAMRPGKDADEPAAAGSWEACPFASQAAQYIIQTPGPCDNKYERQAKLRVAWLEVFEQEGWGIVSSWNCKELWTPPEASDPAMEAGAVALAGIASTQGGASAPQDLQGECANYLLFKPLPVTVEAPQSASSASETASTVENDDDGDIPEGSSRGHGLPLPEVVHRLLKEPAVIRWDPSQRCYEVLDGPKFEVRFNQLRKVRQRHKNGATERPFSRMHNFFVLKRGDKWAKTGTIFRPKKPQFAPPGFQSGGAAAAAAAAVLSKDVEDEEESNSMSMLSGACSVALAMEEAAALAAKEGKCTNGNAFPPGGEALLKALVSGLS